MKPTWCTSHSVYCRLPFHCNCATTNWYFTPAICQKPLCTAFWGWASNAQNMYRPLILNKPNEKFITLVSLYRYTTMHVQQNIVYLLLCRIPKRFTRHDFPKCCPSSLLKFYGFFVLFSQHATVEKLLINVVNITYVERLSKMCISKFDFGVLDFRVGVNAVSVFLGHDVASLFILFPGFREKQSGLMNCCWVFGRRKPKSSYSAPYTWRTDTSRFPF
jgi:hypothetical protein